jgi:hypothetical protein
MSWSWKTSLIVLAGLLSLTPAASARGVVFGRPYSYHVYYGAGLYSGFYGPWWAGQWGPPVYLGPRVGEVKVITRAKDASIYVDGGFAGRAGKLKKFPLRPGTHTLELRDFRGRKIYQERLYVIPGKTIKIHADYRG